MDQRQKNALALKTHRGVRLLSRNDRLLNAQFPLIDEALRSLPDETLLDGEIVALNERGRPTFNLLRNPGSAAKLAYYGFDALVYRGRNLLQLPLSRLQGWAHYRPRLERVAARREQTWSR